MMRTHGRLIFLTFGVIALDIYSFHTWAVAGAATVYQCVAGDQRVFSDQPCAKDAVQREIAEPNRMAAPKIARDAGVARRKPVPLVRSSGNTASDDDLAQRKAACNKLRAQQRAIQEEMRAGYDLAKGERLRQRARTLAAQYAAQRCERYR